MRDRHRLGVKQEPVGHRHHFRRRVEIITEDRVADGIQVHTQLVEAAGLWASLQAGPVRVGSQDTTPGQCPFDRSIYRTARLPPRRIRACVRSDIRSPCRPIKHHAATLGTQPLS